MGKGSDLISREDFKAILRELKFQYRYDVDRSEQVAKLISVDFVPAYDNSSLYSLVIDLLSNEFIDVEWAKMEIERFVWDLNFGKAKGSDLRSINDLYNLLVVGGLVKDIKVNYIAVDSCACGKGLCQN
jgi:hypothetical protein